MSNGVHDRVVPLGTQLADEVTYDPTKNFVFLNSRLVDMNLVLRNGVNEIVEETASVIQNCLIRRNERTFKSQLFAVPNPVLQTRADLAHHIRKLFLV